MRILRTNGRKIPAAVWLMFGSLHLCACAWAADTDPRVERMAAGCAACHGTNGISAGGSIPALAGKPEQDLTTSLREFKSGVRSALVMHQLAKGYSDEQLLLLAAYFSRQAVPSPAAK
ncbi:hypothetical protein BH11PSE11_BH11PSE11_09210 [soil metagenome]